MITPKVTADTTRKRIKVLCMNPNTRAVRMILKETKGEYEIDATVIEDTNIVKQVRRGNYPYKRGIDKYVRKWDNKKVHVEAVLHEPEYVSSLKKRLVSSMYELQTGANLGGRESVLKRQIIDSGYTWDEILKECTKL